MVLKPIPRGGGVGGGCHPPLTLSLRQTQYTPPRGHVHEGLSLVWQLNYSLAHVNLAALFGMLMSGRL